MPIFAELPLFGTEVRLASRTVQIPSVSEMDTIRNEAKPFYPWYRLCPIVNDIITVETRPGGRFLITESGSTSSRDRWICRINLITDIDPAGILTLGYHAECTVRLPGFKGSHIGDECDLAQLEIIGQVRTVFRLAAPLP